jgi:S-(hydroxymethyl)glutathione dehydrogenase/alcohol dehydrogenase
MPDGTPRFTLASDGSPIYHFMGCSTFSEYTVLADISLAKINKGADPNSVCLAGCGIATGWGAVFNNPNLKPGCSVAVWGLGAVGLAVTQAAKIAGATRIYGIDINKEKFGIAQEEFGVTDCWSPLDGDTREYLLSKEKWGVD